MLWASANKSQSGWHSLTFTTAQYATFESRTVLRPRPAVIVDPRGGDVGVAKPFLHLGDVGFVIERIGGGRRAQRMGADLEPELRRVRARQLVEAIHGDRCFEAAGTVVPGRPKQCTAVVSAMMRLILHTAAYWLMLMVRNAIPKPQPLANGEFSTIRLRLLKIAVRIKETTSRVRLAFAANCPDAALFRGLIGTLILRPT
jgi:Transposase DDE domain group 1